MRNPIGRTGWRNVQPPRGDATEAPTEAPAAIPAPDDTLVAPLVYCIVALYAVTFAILSTLQHISFQTHAFDLGNMDQAVWNTVNGRPLEFTNWEGGANRMAAHVEPILFLVAPLYRVYSSPITLLVLQSIVISLGAFPAFWLARDVLRNSFAAAVFSFSYLLAPALEIANLSDFHAVSLSSALLLFAFYYMYKQQYLGFFVAAVLAMSTKEHVPMSVFLMGLYIALAQRRLWIGAAVCSIAAVWTFLAFVVIIPYFNPEGVSPYLSRYDQLGATPMEILLRLLSDPASVIALISEPERVGYLQQLFAPTLYLALLSPATLIMTGPDLAISLLSNFTETYAGKAHYGAVIVPFATASAILGTGLLRKILAHFHRTFAQIVVGLIAAGVLISSLASYYTDVFLPLTDHFPKREDRHAVVRRIMADIPPDAAVSASSQLNPHLAHRRQLSLFPEVEKADHILLDVTASPYPIDTANQWYRVQQLLNSDAWGVAAAKDGYLLLRRGGTSTAIPQEFTDFARAPQDVQYPTLDMAFGDALTLAGYHLEPGAVLHGVDPYAEMTLYWRVNRPIAEDVVIQVSVIDELDNSQVYMERFQAATLWYPSSQWEQGALIRVHVPYLPLRPAERAEVRVGIFSRQPPHDPIPQLLPAPASERLLRDDGLTVRIAELRKGVTFVW